ncbi:MAG: hypothetical protein RIQ89_1029 [Bacteroidota bacterium]
MAEFRKIIESDAININVSYDHSNNKLNLEIAEVLLDSLDPTKSFIFHVKLFEVNLQKKEFKQNFNLSFGNCKKSYEIWTSNSKNVNFEVYNLFGKLLYSINGVSGEVDLDGLSLGIYIIVFKSDTEIKLVDKVVIN